MRRLRLRTLLAVLVLVTTLPVAAFAGWLISRWSAQQQALIDRQNIEQARAILVAVDKEVESTIASLNVLALLEAVDAPDKTEFITIASRILALHPGWHSVRLVDRSLQVLASTSSGQAGFPVLDPDWARQILETGRPATSKVVRDPTSGEWIISIGVPVHHGRTASYVLGAKVYARMFNDVLQRQKAPLEGVVTLLDSTRRIVARTRNQDRYVGQPPTEDFAERSRRATEGSWRTVLLEGTPAYSAWSRSDVTGLTVGIGLPSGPIDEPLRRSFIALVTAGGAVFGVGLVLALLLGRRLVATQTAAASAARSLARGHALPAFDSKIAEAHDLAEGLREAAGILDKRLRERDEAQAEADRHRAGAARTARRRRAAPPNRSIAPRTSSSPPSRTSCARRSTPSSAGCDCCGAGTLDEARAGLTRSRSSSATRARRRSSSRTCSTCRASFRATCGSAWSRSTSPSVVEAALESLRRRRTRAASPSPPIAARRRAGVCGDQAPAAAGASGTCCRTR